VICDPFQLHALIVEWEKAGIRVIELPQSSGRVEADQALYDAVIARSIRHYNDPELNRHVQNTVAVETPRGFRIAKEKTSQKIDAAVALSMAHYGALDQQKAGQYQVQAVPNPFYEYNNLDYPDGFIPKESTGSFGLYGGEQWAKSLQGGVIKRKKTACRTQSNYFGNQSKEKWRTKNEQFRKTTTIE